MKGINDYGKEQTYMFLAPKKGLVVEDTFQKKVVDALGLPDAFSPIFDPLIACMYIPFFLVAGYTIPFVRQPA